MIILQKQFLCYAAADYNLLMFNPLEMAELTRNIVCKNNQRKYYRFRASRFYGGIATADCVGCCLRCVFCWSWNIAANPEECGRFYSPEDVAGKLIAIAKKKKLRQLRISGAICSGSGCGAQLHPPDKRYRPCEDRDMRLKYGRDCCHCQGS
jgi:hypothetical protein